VPQELRSLGIGAVGAGLSAEIRVVGTAGHVDHGKSSLVLALTGRDPDRFTEEKRRGLTIDLGFAWTQLPSGREVGFVDVPGHERFVHNMLAGVGSLDACVLVVAANEGWMPQSEEHLRILELLDADAGLVALTKVDLVDSETVELARLEIEDRLKGTRFESAPIVEVAPPLGLGIEELRRALDLVLSERSRREDRGRPRLWIDRAFSIKGAGTVVTGTLSGGTLSRDTQVEILPGSARARVRTIQTHETTREVAHPGTRTALNLAGAGVGDAARGAAVVLSGQWIATSVLDAEIRVLLSAPAALGRRGAHLLHAGTAEVEVTVRPMGAAIEAGSEGLARLRLARPLPLAPGDRFVLRDSGRSMTIGGGRVLDVSPPRRGLQAREGVLRARQAALDGVDLGLGVSERLVSARLAEGPARLDRLPAELGLTLAEVRSAPYVDLGGIAVSSEAFDEAAGRLDSALTDHHAKHRLEPGMPRPDALTVLGLPTAALEDLARRGRIVVDGSAVRLPDHSTALDPSESLEAERIVSLLRNSAAAPPEASSLDVSRRILDELVREGRLETVGPFLYEAGCFRDIAARVRQTAARMDGLTVSQMRDLLGITRKHAVPLAEALDARRMTTRRGDAHHPGPVEP
jgi:selenocysteine-specific elongation factor